jgi:hypothetical protein
MHTLVDFITHVKGIEYVLSLLLIGGFLLLWEVLKPKPFHAVIRSGKEDLDHLKQRGARETMIQIGKIAAGPFIGLLYVVLLPFGFFFALFSAAVNMLLKGVSILLSLAGMSVSFEWRPMEAYFTGRKRREAEAAAAKSAGK